ncbi:hypothetical protein BC826DRAFT_111173 [Russula brevipes]|nr:hypothetical protein BC826DRAFT_111173 [Russula brevipes]
MLTMDMRFAQPAEGPTVARGLYLDPLAHPISSYQSSRAACTSDILWTRFRARRDHSHDFCQFWLSSCPYRDPRTRGYGKTTLANAVLTHHRVQEHFGDARYFVSCKSVFSSDGLLIELAKTLNLLDGTANVSWSHIRSMLTQRTASFVLITLNHHGIRIGTPETLLRSCYPGLLGFGMPQC